ncbi:Hypothetical predicted protein [Podarcis lilfordi]|uniref:Secreted protein n=1 Tax=Podarcis lilfordi TaxID=74358 RepID=A0AA35KMG3_9SAUR|nr:Hypothetical predicted protein [Podarcis lilfordi]
MLVVLLLLLLLPSRLSPSRIAPPPEGSEKSSHLQRLQQHQQQEALRLRRCFATGHSRTRCSALAPPSLPGEDGWALRLEPAFWHRQDAGIDWPSFLSVQTDLYPDCKR